MYYRCKKSCEQYRVSQKKGTNRMLLEPQCTGSITSSKHALGLGNVYFARFLLRLSRIKCTQDISMGKFGPTAL